MENLADTLTEKLPCQLSTLEKFNLVKSIGEECVQEDELFNLLDKKPNPIAYDGFEPSGRMHIAQVTYNLPREL